MVGTLRFADPTNRRSGYTPAMSSPSQHVAIIGAGPAGLMAAEVLAQGGADVTVYDAMPSAGRKFLMAGRGGLNLTHSEPLPQFLARYREAMPHLKAAIEAFPPQALRDWSEALGQETFVGSSGRVFPKAFKASPLLRAWLRRLDSMGVKLALRHRWTGWDEQGRLRFQTPDGPQCHRDGRDGTGARRRKLAAAGLRRHMGRNARRQRRADIAAAPGQFRLHRRLVGHLSRPLRGTAAQGRGADIRCASRPRRGRRYPNRYRRRRGLCAVGRVARNHYPFRSGDAACGAAARSRHERPDREGLGAERQTVPVEFPAQGRRPLTRCDRIAAGGGQGIRHFARVAVAARPCQPDQRRPDRTHRHSPDRARHFDRGRYRVRRTRFRFHAPPLARRVCGRRDARLGSANRRLSAAGVVRDGRRSGAGRAEVARRNRRMGRAKRSPSCSCLALLSMLRSSQCALPSLRVSTAASPAPRPAACR